MDYGPNALLPCWRRVLLVHTVGLVLFTGCELAERRDPNDVLFGGTPKAPSPTPSSGRSATAVAGAPAATKPLPPLPPPGPSSTLSSLAAGNSATPENDRSLRPVGVTAAPNGSWHGATLHGPQAVDDSGNRIIPFGATWSSEGVTPAGSNRLDSYQQVMEKLRARGMTWNRLETTGESSVWKFSCTIADRNNPGIEQRYEASGYGEYGLGAMRAVLEQIERPGP